jgi:hypothetical protein
MPVPPGRVELRQSRSNQIGLSIFIAVVLAAVAVSQLFAHRPSAVVFIVCGVALALDVLLAWYLVRNSGSTLVITADDITFTRHQGRTRPANQLVISRTPESRLSFRATPTGMVGSQYTGYALKLRDDATGEAVYAGAFGRRQVQQACESQGWSFS